ncbi:methanethiol S-methyltransferase [Puia sp.]|jgi:protein-S-isoprenylcysteine O-methyltransferase Ste14|uniref:methanethiol S-methyltransferase n=1 Tax=Puia sp. TaxID=2045100 RepID=UPI002F40B9B7
MKKALFLLYSLVCYLIFFITFLYLIGFVDNLSVPRPLDLPEQASLPPSFAVLIDLLLIALFGVQHSVMARQGFKEIWTRLIPAPIERSTYVLFASVVLIVLFLFWQPLPATIWSITGPAADIVLSISFLGWGIVLVSTFLINHFHLFGLYQAYEHFTNKRRSELRFRTPLFYKLVRHPLYFGFLVAFWAAPLMTVSHLLFSISMTVYIFIGIWHEERDLSNLYGARYEQYKRATSKIIPFPRS